VPQFASPDDVKAHLNITKAINDDELTLMLDSASENVVKLVGSFDAEAVTERVTANGGTVVLARRPASGVSLADSSGSAVVGFTVNSAAGLLYDVPPTCSPLTATYTAGDGVVPASVTLATVIIAAHLWKTQRGPASSSGPLAATPDDDLSTVPGLGYAIPTLALELLRPPPPVQIA
jgi:hypothetical protein